MTETIGPEVLEDIGYPAFLVCGKTITAVNKPAESYGIPLNTDVNSIIHTGIDDHKAFKNGRLFLTLKIGCCIYCASMVRIARRREIFYIESEIEDPTMLAVSTASNKFMEPLMEAMSSLELYRSKQAQDDAPELNALYRNLHRMYRTAVNMNDACSYAKERSTLVQTCNVKDEISKIIEQAAEYLKQAETQLEFTVCSENIFSLIDKDKLERAILNMITNAIRIAGRNKVIYAALEREQNYYRFSVTCQWPYREKETINEVLNVYHRKPVNAAFAGDISMGAVIARNAATAHKGVLIFTKPDSSTMRFTMSLPILQDKNPKLKTEFLAPKDYGGGYNKYLIELSEILPDDVY